MKQSKSMSFTKATIDMEDMTITEVLKDTTNVFKIEDILKEWHNVENVTITLKKDIEVEGTVEE